MDEGKLMNLWGLENLWDPTAANTFWTLFGGLGAVELVFLRFS